MGLLRTITRPITWTAEKIMDSKPFQKVVTSAPMRGLAGLYSNKYSGTGLGLGLMGYSAANLLAGNPLGLLGVLGGAFRIKQVQTPMVAKKQLDEVVEALKGSQSQNAQLAAQNDKLKYIGLPALGIGGAGAGYLLANNNQGNR